MVMQTRMRELFDRTGTAPETIPFVTIGLVADTNDPQQMGRLRVICPQWGDSMHSNVEDLPWAIYMTPFGGQQQVGTRGPGIQTSEGSVAYGLWAIPKVGSQVVLMCVDGNPMARIWIGCVYDQFTPHTMPHGRFMYDDHPELEKSGATPAPYGPYTSSEKYIQPLADNLKQQFGNTGEPNYEFRSRGADYSVSGVNVDQLNQTYSRAADDSGVTHDNWTSTQGYQASRTDPFASSSLTDKNYDSLTVALTSPGFHAISLDDRQENCRVRFRTTSGHQILMDDTNERIYIATAQGNNWIELDQNGNVDVYSANTVNVHSAKDMNFTSDQSIRMFAKDGIHMHSGNEIRINAANDIHVKSGANLRLHSAASTYLQSDAEINYKAGSVVSITAGSTLNLKSGANTNVDAGGTLNLKAGGTVAAQAGSTFGITGGDVKVTGGRIDLNGPSAPSAGSAADANDANEKPAFFTSRVPDHEPWARTMTKSDDSHAPEFGYNDSNVNRVERGQPIVRGQFWRR